VTTSEVIRILVVEDDEDDFVLTQGMLRSQGPARFEVEWEPSYASALAAIREGRHDLYIVDYRLGERTGLELVRGAWQGDPPAPVLVLTGEEDYAVDVEASKLGVTDYLVKGEIDGPGLERTIRYAIRHHQAMLELRRSEERYAVAVRATNDGIWDWDLRGETIHFSDRWKALLGYEPDELASDRPDAWFDLVHPDDRHQLERDIERHLAGGDSHFENEHRIRHADGGWRWALTRGLTIRDGAGRPVRVAGSLSDITERRRAQDQLVHDALHDGLTGLPNRTLFMDRLVLCLSHLQRDPSHGCAVLYIDIDRFKLVNDSLSHAAGDRLLVELARRVEPVLRAGDTLARRGGDEFTVLLDGLDAPQEAADIAARVADAIARPIASESRRLSMAASIGIAHSFDGVTDPEATVRNADIAMYEAKAHGGGRCRMFDASMHQRVVDRVSLEAQLRQAIQRDGLRTFFQPIVDLRTGDLRGLEALARWPAGGDDVSPAEFIPIAEESGLIGLLGTTVLRSACAALGRWRARGLVGPDVTVSVNVSIRQLADATIVEDVRAALLEADLPAANLVLEITESTLIDNPGLISAVLRQLRDLGVAIQLDDFGTGYSSLTVLHDFAGDTLKIDRTFVETMLERPESETIVRSIVGLAHNLGLRVIAEGIERGEQLEALTALGCECGQGYYFARPLPADEVEALLADGCPPYASTSGPGAQVAPDLLPAGTVGGDDRA
jgi:diguanylate cyclase (GGDEF)-like protein/PAS domain S-box-containing protein